MTDQVKRLFNRVVPLVVAAALGGAGGYGYGPTPPADSAELDIRLSTIEAWADDHPTRVHDDAADGDDIEDLKERMTAVEDELSRLTRAVGRIEGKLESGG